MIITVAQQKGGAGKTTLCCHLAAKLLSEDAAALRVATLDADPQGSLSFWASLRQKAQGENPRHLHRAAAGYKAVAEIGALAAAADIVLVDTPPHAENIITTLMRRSSVILTPVQLSPFDLAATAPTVKMAVHAGRPFLLVANRTPPRSRLANDIRARLQECNMPLARTELGARTHFADSIRTGRGATEAAPNSAAAKEIHALTAEILALGKAKRAA